MIDESELLHSDAWRAVYEHCWRVWKDGFERLRNSETEKEIIRAKERMAVAEEIIRIPFGFKQNVEEVSIYRERCQKQEEEILKDTFK